MDRWGLTGLLHDLDYAETAEDFERHGHVTATELDVPALPAASNALASSVAGPSGMPEVSMPKVRVQKVLAGHYNRPGLDEQRYRGLLEEWGFKTDPGEAEN